MERKLVSYVDFTLTRICPVVFGAMALFLDPIMENAKEFVGNRKYNDFYLFNKKADSLKNIYQIQSDSLFKEYQTNLRNLRDKFKK